MYLKINVILVNLIGYLTVSQSATGRVINNCFYAIDDMFNLLLEFS